MVIFNPHPYQDIAMKFARVKKFCGLILDMGLGKTVITLSVLKELIYNFEVYKPLIVAPKFVTQHTWPAELQKWKHLKNVSISVIAGTEKQRIKALETVSDIYIISRDNIAWLVLYLGKAWDFDALILDELSSFKNHKSRRFKAVRRIRPRLSRVIGLTGTPAPNGLIDLWAQMYLIDQGEALKKLIGSFWQTYFHKGASYGAHIHAYELNEGAEQDIYARIKPKCLSMRASDWLDLPERRDIIKEIVLDDYREYNKFKREKILELPGGKITAFNAPSLYTKLLQYSNGAVYDNEEERDYHIVQEAKLDALIEAVEELQGKPVIIAYQFQSDIDRIKKRLPGVVQIKGTKQINDWNAGKIPILLGSQKSIGHGLNLQDGGHYIFWFGVTSNMEEYWQLVKRIDRQGQKYPVFNVHFTVKGTPEAKVYKGLLDKTLTQDGLFEALQ